MKLSKQNFPRRFITAAITLGWLLSLRAQVAAAPPDTTPPVISCAADRAVECGSPWDFDPPTATDDSGDAEVVISVLGTVTNSGCGATFAAERTWEARDQAGNTATCSQVVTVHDTVPPLLRCVADKTVECGEDWDFDLPAGNDQCVFSAIVFDNSVNDLTNRFNSEALEVGDEIVLDGTARHLQQFIFEYWGVNASQVSFAGNVQARVRFYANDGPLQGNVPVPGTVLYDSGAFAVGATPRATLIIDNFISDAAVPLAGPVPDAFTWTVQFSGLGAGDAAGVDLFSPPVVGSSFPDYWEREGSSWILKTNPVVAVDFAAYATASDDAVNITVAQTVTNATCGATFTATRTWQAADACGNVTDCSQTVTVLDTIAPALICAAARTVECGDAWTFDAPAVTDNCAGAVVVGVLSTATNALAGGAFIATRTWVATDVCGNTALCSQEVAVLDRTPPAITCPPDLMLFCDSPLPAPNPAGVMVADVCDGSPAVQHVSDAQTGLNPRVITRTYQAADASGNISQCQQTITFQDLASQLPLLLQQPRSRTNNVGGTVTFTVVASSCEAPTFAWYFAGNPIPGQTGSTLTLAGLTLANAGDYFAVVSNAAGSTTSQVARLTVNRVPEAIADAVTANTDQPLTLSVASLLANDSDPDNDPLTLLFVSTFSDQGGQVSRAGTQVTYVPPWKFAGPDTFYYTITDGRGGFATAPVHLTVESATVLAPGELEILKTTGGDYLLRFAGDPGAQYEVQRAPDLEEPMAWQAIATVTADGSGQVEFADPTAPAAGAFYRLRSL